MAVQKPTPKPEALQVGSPVDGTRFCPSMKPEGPPQCPYVFSKLPPNDGTPPCDIDISPGDPPPEQSIFVGPRGPVLNDEVLDERYPARVANDGKSETFPVSALFMDRADEL